MPTLWRFLFRHYLSVLFLALVAFIGILLVTRLDEIAQYAVLSPSIWKVFIFALFQTTYIIPIALPIASLLASIVLFQRLSNSGELTALRASGMSLLRLSIPLLALSFFFGIGNLYISSELGTQSHLLSRQMENDFLSMNPFSLLKNNKLLKYKGFYLNTQNLVLGDKGVENLNIALYNPRHERINILSANSLELNDKKFQGENISVITSLKTESENTYDQLIIENQKGVQTPQTDLSLIVKSGQWKIKPDYLSLPLLLASIKHKKNLLSQTLTKEETKKIGREINQSYGDIFRRISLALAVLSFTLLGFAFGVDIGRIKKKRQTLWAIMLALSFLLAFVFGRSVDSSLALIITLYIFPHVLITTSSLWKLKNVNRGIE